MPINLYQILSFSCTVVYVHLLANVIFKIILSILSLLLKIIIFANWKNINSNLQYGLIPIFYFTDKMKQKLKCIRYTKKIDVNCEI